MEPQAGDWIDAAEAARRLGVKPATLYAYVSRGVLRRRRAGDGRRSLFDPAEVEELVRRGRPRRPPGPSELVIESAITALGDGRPFYRGRDALELARTHDFEAVARSLWTGEALAGPRPGTAWRARPDAVAAAVAAQSGLPPGLLPLDRLLVITMALAATDPLRFHLDPSAVIGTAQSLIAGMVEALPPAGGGDVAPPGAGAAGRAEPPSIAARLWTRLCPHPPGPGMLDVLRAALVLLADHELAASTLAARVAASVRADPYAVVTAGLGVLGGPLHGGASYGAEGLIAEIHDPALAAQVIGDRLRRGERIPGFGHTFYRSGDRRGVLLFDLVRAAVQDSGRDAGEGPVPGRDRLAAAEAVLAASRERRLPEPNVDFSLATLASVSGMVGGAGEAIFAVARTAGWVAHALEEYERGTVLRPRAVYTGPPI